MAPYLDRIPALARAFASRIDNDGALAVAVTTADLADGGQLRTAATFDGSPIIIDTGEAYDTRITNYIGTLGDVLGSELAVGDGGGRPTPFATARRTLAAHPELVRDGVLVIVPILGTDDASDATAMAADLDALEKLTSDPQNLFVSAIYPVGAAPKLDGLADMLPGRTTQTPIEQPDTAFAELSHLGFTTLEGRCIPHPSGACSIVRVATDIAGVVHRELVPRCPQSSGRCWSLDENSLQCNRFGDTPIIEGDPGRLRGLEGDCEVD